MSTDIEKVYQVFDPGPLSAQDTDLYVELDDVRGEAGIVNRLANRVRLSDKATCQVVAGHDGSGKSTELRRLQHVLETGNERFFVVFCRSDDDVDRNDVDFPDVLVAIVRQTAGQLKERAGITLKPGYFADRWERLKGVLGSEVSFQGLELQAGMLKLSGVIKDSPDARQEIRKLLEPDTNNWLYAANDVIGDAVQQLLKKGYCGLVILVDDLDKMVLRPHSEAGCSTGEYLFINRQGQLSAFECHLVYAMPLALAYSGRLQKIASLYGGRPPVISMTKLQTQPPKSKPHRPGMDKFRVIIERRLGRVGARASDIFADDEVRDQLILLSGGQPRELMILIREALIGGELPIDKAAVDRAARDGRRAFARQFRAEDWPIIEQVRKTGQVTRTNENDAAFRDLLDSRAILQYVNDEEWYGVNPLIEGLKGPTST